MRKNTATIRDIAAAANVSAASVSMILSGKKLSRFSEETIKNVVAVAKELNYKTEKSGRLILEICPSVFNPYYSTVIQGMDMAARDHGLDTVLYNTYWDVEREKNILNLVKNPLICGVIFAMIPQQVEVARSINSLVPVVTIGDYNEDLQLDGVDINNFNAGKLIAQHLIEFGHKHIAYISTSLNTQHTARTRRLSGLIEACSEYPDVSEVVVFSKDIESLYELNNVNVEFETGYSLAKECMQKNPEITAIVAINDMVAYGIINAIQDEGFSIPKDYSICGFDNIFPSKFNGLQLTSIEHCIVQRGKKAVGILETRLGIHDDEQNIMRVEYQSSLIARNTTGKPRTK